MADRQRRLMILSAAPGVCGLVLLMLAGCRSYSPYGYGYPGGGGYGPAMGGPAGGTTFIAPGSVPGSPVMPGQPIASPPSGTGGSGGTPISGRPSLTPTGSGDPAGKQVPNYADPNDPGSTAPSASRSRDLEIHDEADFQGPMKEKNKLDELKNDSDDDFGSSMNDRRPEDDFADPMPVQTASFAETAPATNDSRPSPFAHSDKFVWMRGIADYDATSSSWYVVYNPEPDSQDPYSGSLTLAPHSKLQLLRPNDVVLVTGKVDDGDLDRFGKPKYAISDLQRLRPKSATPAGP